jgi:RHS repeat-associated protein
VSSARTVGGVRVSVAERQAAIGAGIDGLILTAAPQDSSAGRVRIGVDYGGFADAYGGNYGARLRLVELPACALTTPAVASCRVQTPLPSTNDSTTGSVSAPVALDVAASTVLAITAGTTSGAGGGTYSATSLKPSGSWTGGGSSGSFTYNYPISVPSAASTLVPALSLSYDSGSVDGQTASTQAQSSWVGDGWSGPQSFIEQSFVACSDSPEGSPSPVSTSDNCYAGPILTLSLNGSTTSLVYDASKQVYRSANDDGSVVAHVTGSNNGSGTYNTDYWTITQRDGTVFQFGRNELPGWTSGTTTTNSVDSEPVYSAHPNDPCYSAAGFASSVCTMAYRWNLDYTTDVHHNAIAYYYKQDTNFYGADNGTSNVSYVRDSHLDHIDYGFTDGAAYAAAAPDQVVFTTGDRCVSGTCDPLSRTTAGNWQDVPYDLNCAAGTTCAARAPSNWSTVRLAGIATQQYSTGQGKYVPVDSWVLSQTIPPTADNAAPTLWLASITHTGADTSTPGAALPISLPVVSFAGVQMPNRVDTASDPSTNALVSLERYRISSITSETGAITGISYSPASDCTGPVAFTPSTNTARCYPMSWTPADYGQPVIDWFHKYVVTEVTQQDPTAGQATMDTKYTYLNGGAWHFDDNEVVKPQYRTYGQWRGYGEVQTRTGVAPDPSTLSDTTYYRGMDGDQLPGGATRSVTLTDSQSGQHTDSNALAGDTLETTAYLGDGGPVDHSTITSYWVSTPTATRARTGLPALMAQLTGTVETWSRQAITDSGTTTWRKTETDTSYNTSSGLQLFSYSHGDLSQPTQATCTATTYAPANTTLNLVGLPAEMEVDAGGCGGANPNGASAPTPSQTNALTTPPGLSRPTDVISDARTFYDNPALAQTWPQPASPTWPQDTPTAGDVSVVRQASSYAGVFGYQTQQATVYDSYGRPTASYDANGNKTGTAYTMTGGLTTGITVTNALGQASSTTIDPTRGLTLTSTDPNQVVATEQYDALGRLTGVWGYSRPTSGAANETFGYSVSATTPSTVTTTVLNRSLKTAQSITIYDSFLRPVQTQSPTPQNGRLLTNTFYDTRGWVLKKNNAYFDANNSPSGFLVTSPDNQIPNQDVLTLDGLGRTVVDSSDQDGNPVSTTTTVYNGDRTTTIPPTGGVTTSTATDALGRSTELDQYISPPTLHTPANTFTGRYTVGGGTTQATTYTYNHQSRPYQIADPSGDTWSSSYNLLGQVTGKSDPDAGASTTTYDPAGNIATTTDANNHMLSYAYDPLNRKTAEYDGPTPASPQLASWTYDGAGVSPALSNAIGQLTSSSSFVTSGGTTQAYTEAATGFNVFGEALGTTATIPANEGGLAGSYTFKHKYDAVVGKLGEVDYPANGGLPSENVVHGYAGSEDWPTSLAGAAQYASQVTYDAYGHPLSEQLNPPPNIAKLINSYDPHTGRVHDTSVVRSTSPISVDDMTYGYDLSGNVTSESDNRSGTTTETQCFGYDALARLSQAWTATDSCAADPGTNGGSTVGDAVVGGAYWTSWTFDPLGDRTGQTDNGLSGAANTTTTYTYPTPGAGIAQPHTLTSTSTTGPSGSSATSYQYDAVGNTKQRAIPSGTQTLTWTDTEQLATVTAPTGTTSYVYDAAGTELLRHDPGTTTLFLPDEELVLNTSTNTVTGTRFLALPGGGQAVRTGSGTNYRYEITDQHGTAVVSLDNTAQNATWRQETPYGAPRGTAPTTWPDQHGFLNKSVDTSTGLVDVGARAYDPTTGRFESVDPLLNMADPQSMNGYTYADANPVTGSDPTGLYTPGMGCPDGQCEGNAKAPKPTLQQEPGTSPPPDPPALHDGAGNSVSCPWAMGSGCTMPPGQQQTGRTNSGVGPNCTLTGNGYRSCVTPSDGVNDVVNSNHCGWLGLLCDILPINSFINCWDNPNFDQCATAAIDVAATASIIAKGAELATKGVDILGRLSGGGADWATAIERGAAKVPEDWGPGLPNKKGVGTRWTDPSNPGNGVRIDQGNPDSPLPSQQSDHVVVRNGGRIIGPDGKPIVGSLSENPQAHIPLSEWLNWTNWNSP